MSVVAMGSNQKAQIRRRSMQGTVLLALGVIAAIASVATGSLWLVGAAVVLLVPGVVMLRRVGKSLS
jgi:hypothetical protein